MSRIDNNEHVSVTTIRRGRPPGSSRKMTEREKKADSDACLETVAKAVARNKSMTVADDAAHAMKQRYERLARKYHDRYVERAIAAGMDVKRTNR